MKGAITKKTALTKPWAIIKPYGIIVWARLLFARDATFLEFLVRIGKL